MKIQHKHLKNYTGEVVQVMNNGSWKAKVTKPKYEGSRAKKTVTEFIQPAYKDQWQIIEN